MASPVKSHLFSIFGCQDPACFSVLKISVKTAAQKSHPQPRLIVSVGSKTQELGYLLLSAATLPREAFPKYQHRTLHACYLKTGHFISYYCCERFHLCIWFSTQSWKSFSLLQDTAKEWMETTERKKVPLGFAALPSRTHTALKTHVEKEALTQEPSRAEPQDSTHLFHLPCWRAEGSGELKSAAQKTKIHTVRLSVQPPWRLCPGEEHGQVSNAVPGQTWLFSHSL